jgi:copper resistance protein B
MRAALLLALAPLAFGAPALAAGMDPSMPGMSMPMGGAEHRAQPPVKPAQQRKPHRKTPRRHPSAAGLHAGHDMADMPGMDRNQPAPRAGGGQGMAAMPGMTMPPSQPTTAASGDQGMAGTPGMKGMATPPQPAEEPAGEQPAPAAITDHAADRDYDPAAMAAARATLRQEHGGAALSQVMLNLAEYQARPGGGGYRWEGQASRGGDINRLLLTSEGEGSGRKGLDGAELQALYARAIGPYFNLQTGVRQDFAPLGRTYASVGVQGLVPYWFDVQGALFLSTQGELLGRVEGTYDLRLTQRLILQPRAELNLAAQDTPRTRTGSGLSNAELGLRLRYEIRREFAPYIGVSFDQKVGKTADYARARGEDPAATSLVVGIRAWF